MHIHQSFCAESSRRAPKPVNHNCCNGEAGAYLRLERLAKELAEDSDGGGDLVVDGRQTAGLQGGDALGDCRQVPYHHETQH